MGADFADISLNIRSLRNYSRGDGRYRTPDTRSLLEAHGSPLCAGTTFTSTQQKRNMQNWLRTLLAGYGAYKWGGGCLGTILVFIIIYWLLGWVNC